MSRGRHADELDRKKENRLCSPREIGAHRRSLFILRGVQRIAVPRIRVHSCSIIPVSEVLRLRNST